MLEKIIPSLSTPSLNYFVMQYLFSTKNQVVFDPVGALSHFVVPGVAAQSCSAELLEVDAILYLHSFVELKEYIYN